MRRDMAKLLVERPRIRRGLARRRDRRVPLDDAPKRESIKARWAGNRKLPNENLSPLRRFLRSNVGRPWDDVYSELREHVRFDSTIQYHILQHLWEYVARDVVLRDGVPCDAGSCLWHGGCGYPIRPGRFYVHPESGLLLQVPRGPSRKRRPRPKPPTTLADGRQAHQINGIWYAVELAAYVPSDLPIQDVVLGEIVGYGRWQERRDTYGRDGVYGVRKQQLGKRVLRRLGLR